MKVLITGHKGFIGKNLTEYYSGNEKYNIRATYHNKPALENYSNVEWIYAD